MAGEPPSATRDITRTSLSRLNRTGVAGASFRRQTTSLMAARGRACCARSDQSGRPAGVLLPVPGAVMSGLPRAADRQHHEVMVDLDSAYFSRWYAEMGDVPDKDRLWTRLLGLPPHVLSTSLLTGSGLDEVARILTLGPDDVLLDLACGRAGYGLELIARTGARLVGVDFAPAAIEQARANAERLGLADRADLRVGDMGTTGLAEESVTAVLCLDAANFPDDPRSIFAEAHRVLAPGGCAVFTGWEARDRDDPSVSERRRRVDFGGWLKGAGFTDVEVTAREDWLAAERAAWQAVLALPPSDDPAMRSLQDEAREVLEDHDVPRRVLAVGQRRP